MPFPWGPKWHAWRNVHEANFKGKTRWDVKVNEGRLLTKRINNSGKVVTYKITSRF